MDPTNPLSVKSMVRFLKEDRKAVIFPEGRITTTGSLMKIYEGPGLIADRAGATVLPIAIDGAQYSAMGYLGERIRFPKIRMQVLAPETLDIDPSLQGHERRKAAAACMQDLMYKVSFACYDYEKTVFDAVLQSCGSVRRQPGHSGGHKAGAVYLQAVADARVYPRRRFAQGYATGGSGSV